MHYDDTRLKKHASALSILYVEPNPLICEKLSPLLRCYFKQVDTAHTCQEAMRLFTTTQHDIVLTDVIFKHEDGYRMIEEMKAIHSLQKIIIVSAILDRKRILRLINSLVYGYLLKPLHVEALLKQLEKVAEIVYEKKMLLFYLNTSHMPIETVSTQKTPSLTPEAETSDTFLVFDNHDVDQAIHRMHYKDEAKISAQSFFEQELIDWDTWNDLIMYSTELAEETLRYETLSSEYLSEIARLIAIFANALELSGEFRDIGYALRGLCATLDELVKDFDTLGHSKKMIKIVLDAIIDDLINWTNEVLVHQSAVDVHYIDASLLANIAQLGLSVKSLQQHDTNDETEMELF